ncbi:hypothetical protein SRB5_15030 [Streptomyces sp. RB5]|uniref:ABC transporter permease n=1 Tax=Streptomyces smaragdinus TaxID=2585196 RepID=A0A7K0CD40_9ACTN|nr:ABC transporter permease [Streptomyces smaragdinus]MQY11387.1 hypothetical protein [Streptomyces smaragdinus]
MHPHNRKMIAVILLLPIVVALAVWAFAWPAAHQAPRHLPVGVAGPAAAQLEQRFAGQEGAFEVTRYADEAAARDAIEARDIYGAVVTGPDGPTVLTATAASPAVAQLLTTAAGEGAAVEDVVAAPAADPRGAALAASALPLALAGVVSGALVTLLGLHGRRTAGALVGGAALLGLVAAALAHSWLHILTGNWWAEAGVFGLIALAGGSVVAGIAAHVGPRGIALGAVLVILLGNGFSGLTSAPEMLPRPVGAIGQWLPPGAGGTLLRSVAFFDGNAVAAPLLALGLWVVAGMALVALRAKQLPGPMSSVVPSSLNRQETPRAAALADSN